MMQRFLPSGLPLISNSPRRHGVSVRGCEDVMRGQHIMQTLAAHRGLMSDVVRCTVEFPNLKSRNRRLSSLPKVGRSSVHASAYISVPEVYPAAVIIGRVQRLIVREASAATSRPGSVVTLPFSFNPELEEAHHE